MAHMGYVFTTRHDTDTDTRSDHIKNKHEIYTGNRGTLKKAKAGKTELIKNCSPLKQRPLTTTHSAVHGGTHSLSANNTLFCLRLRGPAIFKK